MSTFVEECRKEWRRLGVPDLLADEMAEDLAADLAEAQSEGVSASEILGESDPRRFAATLAFERGLVTKDSPKRSRSVRRLWPAACVVIILAAGIALSVVLTRTGAGSSYSHLYWVSSDGTVNSVPLGGGKVTTLASAQSYPGSVAVDGTHVYWTSLDGTVRAVPLGGGSVSTLARGQSEPTSVAVDGTHLYWIDVWSGGEARGTVNEVPLGGGSVTTLATGQDAPASLAVDGAHAYWVNWGNGHVDAVPLGGGTASRCRRTDPRGCLSVLAGDQARPRSVTMDGTHVYWVNFGDGTVREVPLGGGGVTTLARGQKNPISVTVDGTHVYWVNNGDGTAYGGDGTVKEVPLGGGSVTTLAKGQNGPESVAVGP